MQQQRTRILKTLKERHAFVGVLRHMCGRTPSCVFKIEEAFKAGCDTFMKEGFRFGDPEEYFHPPGHPHLYRPEFNSCDGCTPPVHGECVLMRRDPKEEPGAEAVKLTGSGYAESLVPKPKTRRSALLRAPTFGAGLLSAKLAASARDHASGRQRRISARASALDRSSTHPVEGECRECSAIVSVSAFA